MPMAVLVLETNTNILELGKFTLFPSSRVKVETRGLCNVLED